MNKTFRHITIYSITVFWVLLSIASCEPEECTPNCSVNDNLEQAERAFCEEHQIVYPEITKKEFDAMSSLPQKTFQLMVWNVVDTLNPKYESLANVNLMVDRLNMVFDTIDFKFELFALDTLTEYYKYEDLVKNGFEKYYYGLIQNNTDNIIDIYLLDHDDALCYNNGKTAGCQKGHGFTGIGSSISSIVIGKDDLLDAKVIVHEVGHFFNLQHTHRGAGMDEAIESECEEEGDYICDTSVDPGAAVYSAMVNYTLCEMFGAYDKNGVEYKPMVNNFMSYYCPCYMKEYAFSGEQLQMMKDFSMSPQRRYFICLE